MAQSLCSVSQDRRKQNQNPLRPDASALLKSKVRSILGGIDELRDKLVQARLTVAREINNEFSVLSHQALTRTEGALWQIIVNKTVGFGKLGERISYDVFATGQPGSKTKSVIVPNLRLKKPDVSRAISGLTKKGWISRVETSDYDNRGRYVYFPLPLGYLIDRLLEVALPDWGKPHSHLNVDVRNAFLTEMNRCAPELFKLYLSDKGTPITISARKSPAIRVEPTPVPAPIRHRSRPAISIL